MLDKIIDNPDIEKFIVNYQTGQVLFLEGDDTQDLYILISGHLDIFKGDKKISEVSGRGTSFGEISFFLGENRTATVKAKSDVKAVRLPKKEIADFLEKFPAEAREITKHLARRLHETSQVLYGLKDICDQLPDAVLMTDKKGKILSWNRAAEKLYGRNWDHMPDKSVEELYEEPEEYRKILEEVKIKDSVREKILTIKHSEKGPCSISTSITALHDGHHNFQGVLSLGRDVTSVRSLERQYQCARYWLIPLFTLLAFLAVTVYFGFPYFSKGYETIDNKKIELKDRLAKDFLLLKSLLAGPYADKNRSKTNLLIKEFFDIQEKGTMPYTGLVILDESRKVFDAYSIKSSEEAEKMLGSSYGTIEFQGDEESIHKVLSLYRTDKDHPMGVKGVEVAFEMVNGDQILGWFVFQMDVDLMKERYDIDEKVLKKFKFKKR